MLAGARRIAGALQWRQLSTKAAETLELGDTCLIRLPERQWSPAPELPAAAEAAIAALGGERPSAVGILRDAFTPYDEPEMPLSQMMFKTSEASLALAAPVTRAHARVHVDHYMFDKQAGVYRLLFNSQDLLQYLPQMTGMRTSVVPDLAAPAARREPMAAQQSTNCVLMVAPTAFGFNAQTAQDNHFMHVAAKPGDGDAARNLQRQVTREFAQLHRELSEVHGVDVTLVQHDLAHGTPDACFPNNWFSTHGPEETGTPTGMGTAVLYPMKCRNRAAERRPELRALVESLGYDAVVDMAGREAEDVHFEGTGVLVLDRVRGTAYVALSDRANLKAAEEWVDKLGYSKLVTFDSVGADLFPVYHTNVMMTVGTGVAIVCAESIRDKAQRQHVMATLEGTHEVVKISWEQMERFCGNCLELQDGRGLPVMAMSTQAYEAFTAEQRAAILRHCADIAHAPIDTLEKVGGGGVRCALAELF